MNFSKSVRDQIATLALVNSVIELLRDHLAKQRDPDVRACAAMARLMADHGWVWEHVVTAAGITWTRDDHGTRILLLPEKQHAQWLRENEILNAAVRATLPKNNLSARAWINAVLDHVAGAIESMPPTLLERIAGWNRVLGDLQSIYEMYDPELTELDEIEQGLAYSQKIRNHTQHQHRRSPCPAST